jgi:translation initiation factor 5
MKKLKKDAKKKGSSSNDNSVKRVATKKAAGGGCDEEHATSPTHSQDADFAAAEDDNVEWKTDTSAEAVRKRMQEQLSAATAKMVMLSTKDTEEQKMTPYDELVEEIKDILGKAATAAQLKVVMSTSTLPAKDVMDAIFEALFHGAGKGFANSAEKNMEYLAATVPDEGAQMILLQAVGSFCGKCSAEALKEVPVVLKVYEGDVLEEETIVQWYDEAVAAGKYFQAVDNARGFEEWHQNAESDE